MDEQKVNELLGDLGTAKIEAADDFADARHKLSNSFGLRGKIEDFDLSDFLTAVKEVLIAYGEHECTAAGTATIHKLRRS